MKSDKLLIYNKSNLNDFEVINLIYKVIKQGTISHTSKGVQYCFVTKFDNVIVTCKRNKNYHSFTIYQE